MKGPLFPLPLFYLFPFAFVLQSERFQEKGRPIPRSDMFLTKNAVYTAVVPPPYHVLLIRHTDTDSNTRLLDSLTH